ncbi:MAG: hypothetical protein J0H89_15340 [Rhizobiales bacterium]|nr:hypothetical protein [Hyphomicrobiales bacterium]
MMLAISTEAHECLAELVVAGGDASPLLESGEEALNAPPLAMSDTIVAVLVPAMAASRNDRFTAFIEDDVMETIGVIGPVGDHLAGCEP